MSACAKNSSQNFQLVNYCSGDSSSDEDCNLERSSPRKRRKGRKSTTHELDEFLGPLDLNGFLKVETLFSDDYNWFEPLKVRESIYIVSIEIKPDISISRKNETYSSLNSYLIFLNIGNNN